MTLELYHGLASTCSKKVRMCLYEKNLAFHSHLLDLQKFEQHRPEYLALNPNGVVPTLVHDGVPIVESSVIIAYLDDCFPEPPLTPAVALDRTRMRLWIKYSDEVAYKAVYAPTWQKLAHRAADGLAEGMVAETLASVPTAERRDRWEKMAADGFTTEELDAAYRKMRTCLADIDTALMQGPWLAGEALSLADLAMIPFVDRIRNLRPDYMPAGAYPHLDAWYECIRGRPSFVRAFDFRDDPRAAELPNL